MDQKWIQDAIANAETALKETQKDLEELRSKRSIIQVKIEELKQGELAKMEEEERNTMQLIEEQKAKKQELSVVVNRLRRLESYVLEWYPALEERKKTKESVK
jgi:multidrug resistance efflux pump